MRAKIGDVVPLDEVRTEHADDVGGKSARLGELASNGFPVPPGFVVTADAYEAATVGLDLKRESPGPALAQRIIDSEIPADIAAAILEAHRQLTAGNHVACVVRSSATAEDLADASFAGQHGTYYYVHADRLLEMIRRCWASMWSAEAVAYRSARGIRHSSVRMAVLVQETVPAEISGVAFTANPVQPDRREIVVESSWGMGAALVDGRVTPDRYVIAADGVTLRERRIADKRFMVPAETPPDGETRLIEVPAALRRRETLGGERLQTVTTWARRCEERFAAPQDVEWALAGERFYVLQSRPITTPRAEEDEEVRGQYVLFKPVSENFTDPVTPLTEDLLLSALQPAVRAIGGRVYVNLAVIRPLLPFRISDEALARFLYTMGAAPLRAPLSWPRVPLAALTCLLVYLVFALVFARTRGLPDDFMDVYRRLCRRIDADPRLTPSEALQRLLVRPGLFDPIGRMVLFVNLSAIRFLPWTLAVRAMLRRWAPALGDDAAAALCGGAEGVLSMEMGREIAALAAEARRVPAVADRLRHEAPDQVQSALRQDPQARSFLDRLDAFLAVHGHRAVKELEMRWPRWSEDPTPVLAMIRSQLDSSSEPSTERAARGRAETERAVKDALDRRPLERTFGLRRRLLRFAAARTRYFYKLRENSRFHHIMAVAVARRKVLAIEAALLKAGRLKCPDDVFFLRRHELEALPAGRLGWRDVEDRIRERRLRHVRLSKRMPPQTIGIAASEPPAPAEPPGLRLEGQCASPGRYRGLVRVVHDPGVELELKPGEVLVAPYTDPAWTPLFLTAGAAVVEVGSYLSHAGTVAREYGMPCVVDVPECMQRLRTGMRVEVDADRGMVTILDEGGDA